MTATSTHWNALAEDYDDVMGPDATLRDLHRAILAHLPPSLASALDLGTGTGALLSLLHARYPDARLCGLDVAPAMIEQARAKLEGLDGVSLTVGSASGLVAEDDSFSAVVSNFALHHLTHDEKATCAREVHRVLEPGGVFAFGDQFCARMGSPDDPAWVEEIFQLFCAKALHYLRTVNIERMLLQVRLLPKFLTADGELPATVEYWTDCLESAGFSPVRVVAVEPGELLNRVIVAHKPPRVADAGPSRPS